MRRACIVTTVLAIAAFATASADAARSKNLWATVNVCDTEKYQDMMGVRASMPGDGDHTRMWMRFAAQYYDRTKQLWMDVNGDGISKWVKAGSGMYAKREAGYTFAFDTPTGGKTFVMRGVVDFKWTKGRSNRIVRTAHLTTKGGHPGTRGADPEDYSSGLCEIT